MAADNEKLIAAIDKFTAQVAALTEVFVVAHVELMQAICGDEPQEQAGSLDADDEGEAL